MHLEILNGCKIYIIIFGLICPHLISWSFIPAPLVMGYWITQKKKLIRLWISKACSLGYKKKAKTLIVMGSYIY